VKNWSLEPVTLLRREGQVLPVLIIFVICSHGGLGEHRKNASHTACVVQKYKINIPISTFYFYGKHIILLLVPGVCVYGKHNLSMNSVIFLLK
jgi:hypothetical protein